MRLREHKNIFPKVNREPLSLTNYVFLLILPENLTRKFCCGIYFDHKQEYNNINLKLI